MGKWTDKLYITHSEWSNSYGGMKLGGKGQELGSREQKETALPFTHCALSLQPFRDPVCSPDGVIFDRSVIEAHLKSSGQRNPITGSSLTKEDLIPLHYHKNGLGEYHCPVTLRVFTDHTEILANRRTGQVFAAEAVKQLGSARDPITDEPIPPKDLLKLRNPRGQNQGMAFIGDGSSQTKGGSIRMSGTMKRVMASLEDKPKASSSLGGEENDTSSLGLGSSIRRSSSSSSSPYHLPTRTTGKVAASMTSTAMDIHTQSELEPMDQDRMMYRHIRKGGSVRLVTNHGELTLDLFCDQVSREACMSLPRWFPRSFISFHSPPILPPWDGT